MHDIAFPLESGIRHRLVNAIDHCARRHHLPGLVIGLASSSSRWTHVAGTGAIDASARFQMTSVTKLVTAGIVFDALRDGHFTLDDGIGEILSLSADVLDPHITVRHALQHTTALESFALHDVDLGSGPDALPRMVSLFPSLRRWAVPGVAYCYGNHPLDLLGISWRRCDMHPSRTLRHRLFTAGRGGLTSIGLMRRALVR